MLIDVGCQKVHLRLIFLYSSLAITSQEPTCVVEVLGPAIGIVGSWSHVTVIGSCYYFLLI